MARPLLPALGAACALAACADPAISMRLELPPADKAARFDVSCVGAVEVFVRGADRGRLGDGVSDPGRPADDVDECIPVEGVTSYADIRRAVAGRFDLPLPGSGLAGVDVRGSTGTCNKETAPGDAIFYGAAEYTGGDDLVIPMAPNLSCNAKRMESVRPVNLLALTRTGQCPAPLPDNSGGVDSATIHPFALRPAAYDPNNDFAAMIGNVATLPLYLATDDASCVALAYGENTGANTTASCVRRGAGVCSATGQIELPFIDGNAAYQATDPAAVEAHGGFVIGAIWGTDTNGNKIRIPGATIRPARSTDAASTKIVYADYPAGAPSPREIPGANSTNATGLFIAYVGKPMDFVVSALAHRDETVRLGSPSEPSTALILLTRM